MENQKAKISIITPTTGKSGLWKLLESVENQTVPFAHILLWDWKREGDFLYPNNQTMKAMIPKDTDLNVTQQEGIHGGSYRYSVIVPGSFIQGRAYGSALRAVGLMLAQTPYVTFADDDCWYEKNHLENLLQAVQNKQWAYCKRKVWKNTEKGLEYIGIDNFESVGDSPSRKVSYEMVDNNCMIFSRRFGTSGAVLYRETEDYNDDRLFYAFLKQHAGQPGKTEMATVNQVCPRRLEKMFDELCEREP